MLKSVAAVRFLWFTEVVGGRKDLQKLRASCIDYVLKGYSVDAGRES
jgi:hypothetical protein